MASDDSNVHTSRSSQAPLTFSGSSEARQPAETSVEEVLSSDEEIRRSPSRPFADAAASSAQHAADPPPPRVPPRHSMTHPPQRQRALSAARVSSQPGTPIPTPRSGRKRAQRPESGKLAMPRPAREDKRAPWLCDAPDQPKLTEIPPVLQEALIYHLLAMLTRWKPLYQSG